MYKIMNKIYPLTPLQGWLTSGRWHSSLYCHTYSLDKVAPNFVFSRFFD